MSSIVDAERKRLLAKHKEQKAKREERAKCTRLFRDFVSIGDTEEALKLLNAGKVDVRKVEQDVIDTAINKGYVEIVRELMKGKRSNEREIFIVRFITKSYPFNDEMLPSLILDERGARAALSTVVQCAYYINKEELMAIVDHVEGMIIPDTMFVSGLVHHTLSLKEDCFHLVFDKLFISKAVLDNVLRNVHHVWGVSSMSTRAVNMLISKGGDVSLVGKEFRDEINKLELKTLMMGLHKKNSESSFHKAFVQHDLSETRLINFIASF